jgi:division protein CdvB (Snf7/Vps24/ESCRT-III family)
MQTIKYQCNENVIVGVIGEQGGVILFSPFTSILDDLKPSVKFIIEEDVITLNKLKKIVNEHTRKRS